MAGTPRARNGKADRFAAQNAERRSHMLVFIGTYLDESGYSPSIPEVAAGVGLRSFNSTVSHLNALQDAGYITRLPASTRTIALTAKGKAAYRKAQQESTKGA